VTPFGLTGDLAELIASLQQKLFDLGGELCIPGRVVIQSSDVLYLEQALDRLNESLPPLKEFVLPGGNAAAAACHLARAICRRAERRVISMAETATVNSHSIRYLNRLSDLLFVIARTINLRSGHAEVLWTGSQAAMANQPPDAGS
jgi:cob(I)alamin adenosyltransferase